MLVDVREWQLSNQASSKAVVLESGWFLTPEGCLALAADICGSYGLVGDLQKHRAAAEGTAWSGRRQCLKAPPWAGRERPLQGKSPLVLGTFSYLFLIVVIQYICLVSISGQREYLVVNLGRLRAGPLQCLLPRPQTSRCLDSHRGRVSCRGRSPPVFTSSPARLRGHRTSAFVLLLI